MITVRADVDKLSRSLKAFAQKQLPFATAQALTATARIVADAQKKNMVKVLDRPAPFTLSSIRVTPATKGSLKASVFMMDRAARYMEPFLNGGLHTLNSRAVLAPKNVPLNSFGNIPAGLLARLKSRPDIFIGAVTFHDGQKISGVWQMPPAATATMRKENGKRISRAALPGGHRKGWKLLIRFSDPIPVKQRLDWFGVAERTARASFTVELNAALGRALATARA